MKGGKAAAFVLVSAVLGLVAWASPAPDHVTDRGVYEATMARGIVKDCGDLHCFRVLVPWVLAPLPGSSLLKWKAYAAACNAAAAIAVFGFATAIGLRRRAATVAAVLSATGFGGLYTLHDPYTSDPLMYALGPVLIQMLAQGRVFATAAVASIGVFAKEFAAAPAYMAALAASLAGRWRQAAECLAVGNCAFIVWIAFTLTMMLKFNYSYGGNESANVASGAALAPWLHRLSPRGALSAMFDEFGPLYLLAPVGAWLAPAELRRLAVAAMPVAAVLGYLQQPDRALWNFHFLVSALGAIALDAAGAVLTALVLVPFAIGNLKVGAQLTAVPAARFGLGLSCAFAAVAAVAAMGRGPSRALVSAEAP